MADRLQARGRRRLIVFFLYGLVFRTGLPALLRVSHLLAPWKTGLPLSVPFVVSAGSGFAAGGAFLMIRSARLFGTRGRAGELTLPEWHARAVRRLSELEEAVTARARWHIEEGLKRNDAVMGTAVSVCGPARR